MKLRLAVFTGLLALLAAVAAGPAAAEVSAMPADPSLPARAATASGTDYTLRFPHPETHRVEVEARFPTGGAPSLDLMMAVWTPGSYLVREFARQVETIRAETPEGRPLSLEKTRKNRWRVTAEDEGPLPETVVLHYRLYAREMSVRTNFVDAGFAILNGAPTFLVPLVGEEPAPGPYRVAVEPAAGWPRVLSPLLEPGGRFIAPDYDALVDAPIYAGDPVVQGFTVQPRPGEADRDGAAASGAAASGAAEILLVHEGGGEVWDYERSERDVEAILHAQRDLWGHLPFGHYLIFNLVTEGGGGLEHASSTVLMTSRWKARSEKGWRDWLGLVSHELFHAWNGKRLRPRALGPFDYENEVYTPSLWFVEGVTSYYDDLLVHRAGLMTEEQFLEDLGSTLEAVQATPGRLVQPLDESSWDAWIKHYQRDENSINRNVSYYGKGALVAWLLDVRIRRATGGAASLDDLMRAAWERWSGDTGFREAEIVDLVAEVADRETADWLAGTLRSAAELDYGVALEWLGLELAEKDGGGRSVEAQAGEPEDGSVEHGGVEHGASRLGAEGGPGSEARESAETVGTSSSTATSSSPSAAEASDATASDAEASDQPAAWLGAETEVREGQLVVTEVRRGTPAWDGGLNVEDELLALDDYRVPPRGLEERLKLYRPGDAVTLVVARRERLLRLPMTFGREPAKAWYPRPAAGATEEQVARRKAWLSGVALLDGAP